MSRDLAYSTSSRRPLLLIGAIIALALGVSAYAWYDHLTAESVTVAGNVSFADRRLDGADAKAVRSIVNQRAVDLLANQIVVGTPTEELPFQLSELGFTYDVPVAEKEIFQARHQGGVFDHFTDWAMTLINPVVVPDPIELDKKGARANLSVDSGLKFSNPKNPGVALADDGHLVVTPGSEGSAADIDHLVDRIEDLDLSSTNLRVETRSVPIPPEVSDAAAAAVVDSVNEATGKGATFIAAGHTRQLIPERLRSHIIGSVENNELVMRFNLSGLQAEIESLYPDPVGDAKKPILKVAGENVEVEAEGSPPDVCCDPDTASKIASALLSGAQGPFSLATRPETDPVLTARYDGSLVTEMVSTFTTPHRCCENRVKNIQRMADLVRGYYLLPDEVLSLNDHIGPRTAQKGFVPAGAIRMGRLTPEVGGGVSQFATTIFNAAYFAGLDFLSYQAHSLYFSRYPYGREATISNPAPDLVIQNTTGYPVLIWTSYTSTSITVSMYSTKNVEAEQIATRSSKRNKCTYVETDRLRTYSDGRQVVDTFVALYRPADGIDCNGNEIPELN